MISNQGEDSNSEMKTRVLYLLGGSDVDEFNE